MVPGRLLRCSDAFEPRGGNAVLLKENQNPALRVDYRDRLDLD